MSSWNQIKTRDRKKTSASWRYAQFSELQPYFPMIPTTTSPKDKVSNLNEINESLYSFGTEMSSRIRINFRNWKQTSASLRYAQFSELQPYFPMIPTTTSPEDKVSNLYEINRIPV